MRLAVLASGSNGNAIAVEHEGYGLFFDAGLSGKRHSERLCESGLNVMEPHALFITHEHSDHIKGAGIIARKWQLPIYATSGSLGACKTKIGKVPSANVLVNGENIEMGPFTIHAFSVAHDAADPSGFIIEWSGGRLGIATDLGKVGPLVKDSLSGCTALVIEFNHDEEMLWNGSYSWPLKERIASNHGHLSNEDASVLLERVQSDDLVCCVLAHLSEENNKPHLAEVASQRVAGESVTIYTGMQDKALQAIVL